jgi:hypothetical protein
MSEKPIAYYPKEVREGARERAVINNIGNIRDSWNKEIAKAKNKKMNEMIKLQAVRDAPKNVNFNKDYSNQFDNLLGTYQDITGTKKEITGTQEEIIGTPDNVSIQNSLNFGNTTNNINGKQKLMNLMTKNINNLYNKKREQAVNYFNNTYIGLTEPFGGMPGITYNYDANIIRFRV